MKIKKRKIFFKASLVILLAAVLVSLSTLSYLFVVPNADPYEYWRQGDIKEINDYTLSEQVQPDAPMGVVHVAEFDVTDSLYEQELIFYAHHQYVRVFVEEELVYQWIPDGNEKIGKTLGSRWVSVPFCNEDLGKRVLIEITPVYSGQMDEIPKFLVGPEQEIYENQLRQDSVQLVLSGTVVAVGLVFLFIAIARIIRTRKTGWRLAYLGMFSVLIGVWCLTDVPFLSYVMEEQSIFLYDLSIYVLMFVMMPLVCFIGHHFSVRWPIAAYVSISSAAAILQISLQLLGISDLRDTLTLTHSMIILGILTILLLLFLNRNKKNHVQRSIWERILPLICALGVLTDLFYYYIYGSSTSLIFSVSSVLIYITICGVMMIQGYIIQEKKLLKQETQLLEARTAVMLSQIQPHFLYNTLNSIAELCLEDSEKAYSTTIDFAEYLRTNLKGIQQKSVIPFELELQHVKRYLSLEKVRFEEDLQVVYDIQVTNFSLPQLSIQPLVENAVKYGVGEREEGGTVTVRTYEEDAFFCISVEDDGVGFDAAQVLQDGKVHLGIDNSRMRIQRLCGGSLDISSEIGKGTVAKIRIPKEEL